MLRYSNFPLSPIAIEIKYIREEYRTIGFFTMNVHKYKIARKCVRWRKIWEEKLSSLGKCVLYEVRSEKREKVRL